jgi:hypothetical protein
VEVVQFLHVSCVGGVRLAAIEPVKALIQ